MITDERFSSYLNSLYGDNTLLLQQLEEEAHRDNVPIIRKETQQLLKVLLSLKQPSAILEVGAAIGFSSILMAQYNPAECKITTIENYEKRIPVARENIKKAHKDDVITLLEGDATDILKQLEGPYDFIFMDAAKAQYIVFFPEVKRLLAPGGMLISDNVLQDGDVVQSRFAVTRRNRTIHKRMREYLYALTHDEELDTTVLTVGDGVTISVKKGEQQ